MAYSSTHNSHGNTGSQHLSFRCLNQSVRAVIEHLLETLPLRHEATGHTEACLGSAICAGLACLVSMTDCLPFYMI